METEVQLPDGRVVTLVHEGELTDDAVRNAVSQLGYDVNRGSLGKELLGEGTRIGGAIAGAIKGSKKGPIGAALGGLLGAALAEPAARAITPREESIGESIANVGLSAVQPASKPASLAKRLLRGGAVGAALSGAHKVTQTGIDEQRLPSLEELAPNLGIGAVLGGGLEGILGPRVSAQASKAITPDPASAARSAAASQTKELPITASLDKPKPTSLEQANAEANAIATPTSKPVAPVVKPKVVSVDDIDAIDEAAAAQSAKSASTWQYTIQKPQKLGDKTIPGYIQIDEIADGKNVRSSNLDALKKEGIDLPEVPDWVPQGQYTKDELESLIKAKKVKGPEKIVSAAIKTTDGEVFKGKNHALAAEQAEQAGKKWGSDATDEGFVTSTGRYVTREEAIKLADAADQLKQGAKTDKGLFVEALESEGGGNPYFGTKARKSKRNGLW